MADYYTKPEADALFAAMEHDHDLENLGGNELPASRVAVPDGVAADFDNAFTVDEALVSIADQLGDKAANNHTHTGYAAASHTHSGYAAADHAHTGYAESGHTHTPAAIGAAPAIHAHDYAAPTHSHAQSEISGLEAALGAKAPNSALTAKADLVDGKVPASQLPGFVDDVVEYDAVTNFPATGESGKLYVATTAGKTFRWSGSTYVEVAGGVALGETSSTAYRGDRGKTAYDHSQNGTVHVTAAQKATWDSKAAGNHTHTPADIGAAATVHTHDYAASGHTHAYADLTGKPTIPTIPSSLPANGGNADTVDGKHAADFATAGHSHTVFPSDTTLAAYKLVYIATNGNDNNNGFTQATAMATIKGVIKKYADSYKALDIRLLDGTYTEDTWSISVDQCNLSIRSVSENKDAVTLNLTGNIETNVNKLRLYNMTINVTGANVRALSVTAGSAYAYNVRFNVPTASDASCVNVYNGASAFLMNCVLNAGTGTGAGAAVYGNQAMLIKAINCTSERKVNLGFHAHNGSDIWYTDTINATTKTKQTSWGKCTVRS